MGVARSEARAGGELGLEYTVADLGTPEGCARAVAETERRLGPVEILVCNHGIGSAHERVIWEQDPKVWSETMQINLDGPFHLSRLVVRGMVERLRASSSTRVRRPARWPSTGGQRVHQLAKHGLLGLMRAVAQDAGPHGITSNAVLPGWVRTEMAERSARAEAEERGITPEQVWEDRAAGYRPGRVATPQEVAEMIAFFASEESSGVSGEAIRVALGSVW